MRIFFGACLAIFALGGCVSSTGGSDDGSGGGDGNARQYCEKLIGCGFGNDLDSCMDQNVGITNECVQCILPVACEDVRDACTVQCE